MTSVPPPNATLQDWLTHIEQVHPRAIDMGLERVNTVKHALGLSPAFPVITVGGTNGKGSACAMLEAILHEARYKVGCYTSPHILRYNERVRIGRKEASDDALIAALRAVEAARGDIPLTYFEFSTLAAVWLFVRDGVDAAVLEVGLGGRLDAVNAFDADCALLMSVALDHMDYLGDTREAIGFEKAGIFRSRRPAVCADPHPPSSVTEHAATIDAELLLIGRDFGYEAEPQQWRYWGPNGERHGLPHPALRGEYQIANAAAALAALDSLRAKLPVAASDIRTGLLTAENPARFQVMPGRPVVILDVAHNPAAARALAHNLAHLTSAGRTYAVFSMLKDKDIAGVIDAVKDHIDEWLIAGSEGARGADASMLREELARASVIESVSAYDNVAGAYAQACDRAAQNDRIIVFGSFYTVAAVMAARAARRAR
ncbi:MAG TPA: bifunctional tetrahydrofolate synthase/dihydrofolate synthase [Burkholderiales bacterium]|jgi:dihydrofolate synthase/folylpolyglutamate synthase|nr:bifunctional tetrahydrofolate synthase/dihydrofolate synthase [Burkholderiales bacterium]